MKRDLAPTAGILCVLLVCQATCLGAFSPDGMWIKEGELAEVGVYRALVVGVSAYQHLPRLPLAAGDARQVSAVLAEGYGFSEIVLLIDAEATLDAIRAALANLSGKSGPKDSLLIYFAGRSDTRDGKGSWVPADGDAASGERLLTNEALVSAVERKACAARHVLIVSDALFSPGLIEPAQRSPRFSPEYLRAALRATSRQCLTSGGAPAAHPDGGGTSVFCHFLLKGITETKRRVFVTEEVYPRLWQHVFMKAPGTRDENGRKVRQKPRFGALAAAGHELGGAFVFIRATANGNLADANAEQAKSAAAKGLTPEAMLETARGMLAGNRHRDALPVLHAYAKAGEDAGKTGEFSEAAQTALGKSLGEAMAHCRVAVKCKICKGEGVLRCTKCKGHGHKPKEHVEVVVLEDARTVLEDMGTFRRAVKKPAVTTGLRWRELVLCKRCGGKGHRSCRACEGTGCPLVKTRKSKSALPFLAIERPHASRALEERGDRRYSLTSDARRDTSKATARHVGYAMVATSCLTLAAELSLDTERKETCQHKIRKMELEHDRVLRAMVKRWQDESRKAKNDIAKQAAKVRRDYQERQKEEAEAEGEGKK